MSGSIGSLKVYLTGDNKGLARSLRHSKGLVNNFARSMPLMSTIVVGSLTAMAYKGLRNYTAFDKKLRNVNTIARLNEYQFKEMGKELLNMSTKYGKAGTELADGLYDINSAGFKGAEGMRLLDISTKASIAGISEVGTASRLIAQVLNAYGKGVNEAEEVSDVLFKTVEKGVVYFSDLAQYMGASMASASAMSVSLEEVTSAFGAMTKMGITPSDSGTAINRFLLAMIEPKKELQEMLRKYGYQNGEEAFKQTGLVGVLQMIQKETKGSTTAIERLGFGIRAIKTAFNLTKDEGKIFHEVLAEVGVRAKNAGASTNALGQQQKALSYQWDRTAKAFTKIGIKMVGVLQNGQSLSNILKGIANQVDKLANWFSDASFQINTVFIAFGKHLKIVKVLGEWCFGAVALVVANFIHNFSEGFGTITYNAGVFFVNMYRRTGAFIADIWDNIADFPERFKNLGQMITDIMVAVVRDIGNLFASLGKSVWEFLKSPLDGFNFKMVESDLKKTLSKITGGKYNLGLSTDDQFTNSKNVKTEKYEKANFLPSALIGLQEHGLKMLDKFIDIEGEYNKKQEINFKTHMRLATAMVKNTDQKNNKYNGKDIKKQEQENKGAFEIKLPELLTKDSVDDYKFSAIQKNPMENQIEKNTKGTSFYVKKLYEATMKKKQEKGFLLADRNQKMKEKVEIDFTQDVNKLFAGTPTKFLKEDKSHKYALSKESQTDKNIDGNTRKIKDVAKRILDVALAESRKSSSSTNATQIYACNL